MRIVIQNSVWQIGNGQVVNFWKDKWLDYPIVHLLDIPQHVHGSLHSSVAAFIRGNSWEIYHDLAHRFPSLAAKIKQILIPLFNIEDSLVWTGNESGCLTFKEAFNFLHPSQNAISWCKLIWSAVIPPSKSFLVWRLLHAKLPTDENLMRKGCNLASVCSLCGCSVETSNH